VTKKAKTKRAPSRSRRPSEHPQVLYAQAVSDLASAIREHANALAARGGAAGFATEGVALEARVTARPLSRDEILKGIEAVFNTGKTLKDDDEINELLPGGPGRVVSMWEEFDNYPAFRERGLAIGPNDLRFVKTVKELVGVIAWGLKMALRR
jgi:hypothetical protein